MFKRSIPYFILVVLVFSGLFVEKLSAQEKQEITVTIDKIPSDITNPDFLKGEELREQNKFRDAIAEYQKALSSKEPADVKAVVQYYIGICYLWMGKKNDAELVFKDIMKTYPDNGEVMAYTNYCLSWIDVQRGNYTPAIYRLQRLLDENRFSDEAFCSRAQFQIGRIYLSFVHDYERAEQAFQKVLDKYPNSEITNHPFLENFKRKE